MLGQAASPSPPDKRECAALALLYMAIEVIFYREIKNDMKAIGRCIKRACSIRQLPSNDPFQGMPRSKECGVEFFATAVSVEKNQLDTLGRLCFLCKQYNTTTGTYINECCCSK